LHHYSNPKLSIELISKESMAFNPVNALESDLMAISLRNLTISGERYKLLKKLKAPLNLFQ
jgi:hypothetical protein